MAKAKNTKKRPTLARTLATEEFLNSFRKALPEKLGGDPFVIIGTQDGPGGIVSICQCKCSNTLDCGGGGGGS